MERMSGPVSTAVSAGKADKYSGDEDRYMNPHGTPFVHLRYSPRWSDAGHPSGIPLLVIQAGPGLEIVIRPDWHKGVLPDDQEYLTELMDDWRNATPAEIPTLLESLSELSIGPLKSIESGLVDLERRSALIKQVCGTSPDADVVT
jgi:hypothetical protein